jgi:diguanylate cyclase (GGDEF)-like protein/PAS domain S-box-containing protein
MAGNRRSAVTHELQILATIGRILSETLDPVEFLAGALRELLAAFGLSGGAVYLLQGEEFVLVAHEGLSPEFVRATARLPRDHHRLGPALAAEDLTIASDLRSPLAATEGVRLVAYAPLCCAAGPLGVLAVGRRDEQAMTGRERTVLRVAASQLGLALGQAVRHQETRELLQRHRMLLDTDLVGITVVQAGKIVYANAGLAKISGYGIQDLVGRDPLSLVHPEDRDLVRRNLERRLAGEDVPASYRFRGIRGDGTAAHVETNARRITYHGHSAVQVTLRDVTEEEAAGQLRRSFLSVGSEILAARDVVAVLAKVAQAVVDLSPFRRAAISVYDLHHDPPLAGQVKVVACAGLTSEEEQALRAQGGMSPERRALAFREEFRVGRSYHIPHDRLPWEPDLGLRGRVGAEGFHPNDFLFIPLRGRAGIIGHLSVDEPVTSGAPIWTMLPAIEMFADLAALAVERIVEYEDLLRHKEWLRGAHLIAQDLSRYTTVESLCQGVLTILKRELRYEYGVILLVDGDELAIVGAESDVPDYRVGVGERFSFRDGIVGWVAANRAPLRVNDVSLDPRYLVGHPAVRSELAVPVVLGEDLVGVINVESTTRGRFQPEDEEFLIAVAAQLAVAIRSLRAQAELREVAIRDPLTGLYNRRFFGEVLDRELERSRRYGHPVGVLMIDLDHFRLVNNRFGHQKGDEVLCQIARILVANVRAVDTVFRYGGDELVVLLPETNGRAMEAATRLRQAVQAWSKTTGFEFEIGLSIGISTYDPCHPRSAAEILEEADQRMYQDKRSRFPSP